MNVSKPISEAEALGRLASLCSTAEHCSFELTEKLRRWEVPAEAQARIMERLQRERYFDDERYARALVADKVKYNRWGRRKVEQALWQKHIDEAVRERVLSEVSDDDYASVLRPLLEQKRRSLRNAAPKEAAQRLVRFALSRGFDYSVVRRCMDVGEDDEEAYSY